MLPINIFTITGNQKSLKNSTITDADEALKYEYVTLCCKRGKRKDPPKETEKEML